MGVRRILLPWEALPQERAEIDEESPLLSASCAIWTPYSGDVAPAPIGESSLGQYRSFNGSSQYGVIPYAQQHTAALGVTAFVWLRTTAGTTLIRQPLSRVNSTGQAALNFSWGHTNSSFAQAWASNNGTAWTPLKYSSIPTDEWVMLSATARTGTGGLRIYLNGEFVSSATITGLAGSLTGSVFVGAGSSNGSAAANYFPGDEILAGYVDRAWSDDDHARFYERPAQIFREPRIWVPLAASGGGGETVYDVSLSEAGSAADVLASFAMLGGAVSEAASASDAPAAVRISTLTLTEAGTAGDAVATGATAYEASISEATTATDLVSATAARVAALAEPLAAADSITVSAILGASVAEAATAGDTTNWGGAFYAVELAEAATLTDAVTAGLQALAAMLETASATDLPMVTLSMNASTTEVLTAADAVAGSAIRTIEASVAEAAGAFEIIVSSVAGVAVLAGRFYSPSRAVTLQSPSRRVLLVPPRRIER